MRWRRAAAPQGHISSLQDKAGQEDALREENTRVHSLSLTLTRSGTHKNERCLCVHIFTSTLERVNLRNQNNLGGQRAKEHLSSKYSEHPKGDGQTVLQIALRICFFSIWREQRDEHKYNFRLGRDLKASCKQTATLISAFPHLGQRWTQSPTKNISPWRGLRLSIVLRRLINLYRKPFLIRSYDWRLYFIALSHHQKHSGISDQTKGLLPFRTDPLDIHICNWAAHGRNTTVICPMCYYILVLKRQHTFQTTKTFRNQLGLASSVYQSFVTVCHPGVLQYTKVLRTCWEELELRDGNKTECKALRKATSAQLSPSSNMLPGQHTGLRASLQQAEGFPNPSSPKVSTPSITQLSATPVMQHLDSSAATSSSAKKIHLQAKQLQNLYS